MRSDFTLSVIVPVYNERLTIRRLVERVRAVPIRKEIIIVDDASTDGTTEVIRDIAAAGETDPDNRIRALFHPQNAGKGAAIRTAIPAVSGDIALIQDADLEYDPDEYPNLIEPILAGHADVVFGSRFLGGPHRVLFFRHSMGNKLLTFLSNLCTDLNLTDMETCYKVFRSDVLKRLQLVSNRFGIEPEITAKVARLGVRVYEVPVSYHGREYWEGKKIGWKDGVAAIWTIARAALSDDGEPFGGEPGMRRVRHTRRYTDWVWSRISPFVGDRILEVGDGSYTRYLRHHSLVVASGDDGAYLGQLRTRFAQHDNIRVQTIDWTQPALDPLRAERFDTVLCLNGLEYAAQDDDLLAHFADLLGPGGRVILQVPAMHGLYGEMDRAIGHLRRYERDELAAKLRRHGFAVELARYANLPGALSWYLNSRVLRRGAIPALQVRLAGLFVPWLRLEERFNPARGLTLLAVGRKE
jgi:glycosyltransferase involved in cell wall biosynthesis